MSFGIDKTQAQHNAARDSANYGGQQGNAASSRVDPAWEDLQRKQQAAAQAAQPQPPMTITGRIHQALTNKLPRLNRKPMQPALDPNRTDDYGGGGGAY